MLPLTVPPHFRIIAHRGASGYAPENSLRAFELAYAMGAREFELDLQRSLDGEIVICHEHSLARFGHPGLDIEQLAWPQLATLDLGSWFSPYLYAGEPLLRLPDLFTAFGERVQYHIEFKQHDPALIPPFLALLERAGLQPRSIVTSFSFDCLLALRAANPGLRLGWLVREAGPETIAQAAQAGLFQLCPRADQVTPALVAQIHAALPEARAWGVNAARREDNLALLQQLLAAGCDGVTINWPDWLRQAPAAGPR